MRQKFILLLTLVLCLKGYGQVQDTSLYFDKTLMKRLINKEFTNLISPESQNIIGNFASLDLKEAEADFAGNVVFNNGSIFGIKAKGKISDGLLPVFSNTKFNTKFGVDAQYNFLFHNKKSLQFYEDDIEKYKKQKLKIDQEKKIKSIEITKENFKNELMIEIVNIQSEIKKKETLIEDIGTHIDSINTELPKATGELKKNLEFKKDSLVLQRKKLQIDLDKQNVKLEFKEVEISKISSTTDQLMKLGNWYLDESEKAESNLNVYGFKLGWFSVGYGLSNNSFRFFDPSTSFDNQVSKHNFLSHSVKLNYNFFCYSPVPFESVFISVGAKYSFEDDMSSLTKIKISETESYGTNNERKITDEYNAFKGSYKDSLHSLSLNAELYYFLFKDNRTAIHIYPEEKFMTERKPITNLGVGFLLTFKKQSDKTNIVNAELYANLFDLVNNRDSESTLWERSSYGLRFTFPINFNSFIKPKKDE